MNNLTEQCIKSGAQIFEFDNKAISYPISKFIIKELSFHSDLSELVGSTKGNLVIIWAWRIEEKVTKLINPVSILFTRTRPPITVIYLNKKEVYTNNEIEHYLFYKDGSKTVKTVDEIYNIISRYFIEFSLDPNNSTLLFTEHMTCNQILPPQERTLHCGCGGTW